MPTRADVLREVRRSRRRRRRTRAFTLLFLLFLIFVGTVIFLNHYFLITKIEVVGAQAVASEEIILKTSEVLAGRAWYIWPRRSLFFYPQSELIAVLEQGFPRLAAVRFARPDWGTLRLVVRERQPDFIFCDPTQDNCYYLDRSGVLFAEAPRFSGYPRLIITAPVGFSLALGFKFASVEVLAWMKDFVDQLPRALEGSLLAGERAVEVSFGEEQDLKFSIEGWVLLVSRRQPPAVALENLAAALGSDTFKRELVARHLELEYLDLRFERKVFYKFLTSAIMEP